MKTQIYENYADFLERENRLENGVSKEFSEQNSAWEKQNETNHGCWNCSYCSDCSYCSYCSYCSDCSGCSGCSDLKKSKPVEAKRDDTVFIIEKEGSYWKAWANGISLKTFANLSDAKIVCENYTGHHI